MFFILCICIIGSKRTRDFQSIRKPLFSGQRASPSYYCAKKIIKLIHSVAEKVNYDPAVKQLIKIVFLENYRVSMAEPIFRHQMLVNKFQLQARKRLVQEI